MKVSNDVGSEGVSRLLTNGAEKTLKGFSFELRSSVRVSLWIIYRPFRRLDYVNRCPAPVGILITMFVLKQSRL